MKITKLKIFPLLIGLLLVGVVYGQSIDWAEKCEKAVRLLNEHNYVEADSILRMVYNDAGHRHRCQDLGILLRRAQAGIDEQIRRAQEVENEKENESRTLPTVTYTNEEYTNSIFENEDSARRTGTTIFLICFILLLTVAVIFVNSTHKFNFWEFKKNRKTKSS